MIRRKIGHLMVASSFVLAMLGAGATIAFATETTTPGTELTNDVQVGEQGETATANDVDTADVDEDGEDEDVDEIEVAEVHVTEQTEAPETSEATNS